jgi:hypothetical protein
MHAQTKHFDIQHHYVKEKFKDGTVYVQSIPFGKRQVDLFTKPLAFQKFVHNYNLVELAKLPTPYPN